MKLVQRAFTIGKSFLLALLIGACLLALTTPSAHASAATTSAAQSHHASVQQQIAAQLKRKPDGKQLAWNELAYDNGNVIVKFAAAASNTVQPYVGYGNCPDGFVCVWHGTNYSGAGVFINATFCHGPIDLWNTYGWYGISSYSSTNGANTAYVYDTAGGYDFNILTGPAHHSSNTSGNGDARYAQYVYIC